MNKSPMQIAHEEADHINNPCQWCTICLGMIKTLTTEVTLEKVSKVVGEIEKKYMAKLK